MIDKFFKYILPVIIVAYVGFYLYNQFTSATRGELAPEIETELIDGTPFKLSELQGKFVLLDFWASWCGPCRIANPQLVELHKKYPDKLVVVTVALEKGGEQWKIAAQQDGFAWKHQIVEYSKFVQLSSIARDYGVSSIPTKFLISPEGVLLPKMSFEEIDELLNK